MSPDLDTLRAKARMLQGIRAFFRERGHLEVDTPLLGAATGTDVHIESVTAVANGEVGYLQTSPEFYMKRLLAAGSGSIYQLCHAFRDEERGRYHRAEFSLLEWYSVDFDYQRLMDEVEALIQSLLASSESTNLSEQLQSPFKRLSYVGLLRAQLDITLETISLAELRAVTQRQVPSIDASDLEFDACLDLLISLVITPRFKGFTFIYDYPASQASLAKLNSDNPLVAERFELYYGSLELANGFTELADAGEQRARFEADNATRRARGQREYPIDEAFLHALEAGLPDCAGVALGLDRLLMVLLGCEHIDQVSMR